MSRPARRADDAFSAALPDGREVVLFQARRPVPNSRSESVTLVTGWCVRDGDAPLAVVRAFGSRTDGDGKGGDDTMRPLAHLTIDDRTFWFGPSYGYESESFRVVEVTNAKPRRVMEMFSGGR